MAELVDAYDSGSYARKGVEVQVLFWAPFFIIELEPRRSGAIETRSQICYPIQVMSFSSATSHSNRQACPTQGGIALKFVVLRRGESLCGRGFSL